MTTTRQLIENAADTSTVINGHTLEEWIAVAVRPGNCGQLDAVLRQQYLHEPIENPTSLQQHLAAMWIDDAGANTMHPNTDAARRSLSIAVRDRRAELGLSKVDVHARGGPSALTLTRIEHPRAGDSLIRPKTMRRLDHSLAWTAGSTARVLDGGQPEVADSIEPSDPGLRDGAMSNKTTTNRPVFKVDTAIADQLMAGTERAWANMHDPVSGKPYPETAEFIEELKNFAQVYLAAVQQHIGGLNGVITAARLTSSASRPF